MPIGCRGGEGTDASPGSLALVVARHHQVVGLGAGPHDHRVDVHVVGAGQGPPDCVRDVLAHQGGVYPGIHLVGGVKVAAGFGGQGLQAVLAAGDGDYFPAEVAQLADGVFADSGGGPGDYRLAGIAVDSVG